MSRPLQCDVCGIVAEEQGKRYFKVSPTHTYEHLPGSPFFASVDACEDCLGEDIHNALVRAELLAGDRFEREQKAAGLGKSPTLSESGGSR